MASLIATRTSADNLVSSVSEVVFFHLACRGRFKIYASRGPAAFIYCYRNAAHAQLSEVGAHRQEVHGEVVDIGEL